MTETIYVTGYPRSGNSWTSQLLGDVLHCAVGGLYSAKPLCTEGQDRGQVYYVAQLHLKPFFKREFENDYTDGQGAVPNAWAFAPLRWNGEKVVHVVRDPRDVTVSAWSYWHIDSIEEALTCLGEGLWPLKAHWSWQRHVGTWLGLGVPVQFIRYEDLQADTEGTLRTLLETWGIKYNERRLPEAVERQSFATKRAAVEKDGGMRPYGKDIQLLHMRKGVAGDWQNHFTPAQVDKARRYFGDVAARLGYEL